MQYILCAYFLYLPFQIALNPATGIDLASIRIFTLALFFYWLINGLIKRKLFIPFNKTSLLLYTFLASTLLSLFFSENLAWSVRKILFLFSLFPIYLVVASTAVTHKKRAAIHLSIVAGATLAAFVGIIQFSLQFFLGISKTVSLWQTITLVFLGSSFGAAVREYSSWLVHINNTDFMRLVSTFPDPHMFSFYVGMALPLAAFSIFIYPNYRPWLIISTLMLLIADILTFSRGGYIALFFSVLYFLLYFKKNIPKKTLLLIVFGCAVTIMAVSPVRQRLFSSFDSHEGSNIERLSNWKQATKIFLNNPLGVGIGNYSIAINPTASYRDPIYAHNTYLDIAAELGILGLLSFIAFIWFTMRTLLKRSKQFILAQAAMLSLLIFLLHSLFDTPIYSVHILPLFLTLIALHANEPYV